MRPVTLFYAKYSAQSANPLLGNRRYADVDSLMHGDSTRKRGWRSESLYVRSLTLIFGRLYDERFSLPFVEYIKYISFSQESKNYWLHNHV